PEGIEGRLAQYLDRRKGIRLLRPGPELQDSGLSRVAETNLVREQVPGHREAADPRTVVVLALLELELLDRNRLATARHLACDPLDAGPGDPVDLAAPARIRVEVVRQHPA